MRRFSKLYRLLALSGLLGVVAWGCTTESPTAPRQVVPPLPPASGQAYYINVEAEPGGIVVGDMPTGAESATLIIEVRLDGPGGPRPIDGTTILVRTSLGSFSNLVTVRETGASVVNGRTFLTLFAGGTPVQLGVATVQVFREDSVGQTQVPISLLAASFFSSNPEGNLSVQFTETAAGNPDEFFWEFGDGGVSSSANPHHIYPGPGTYQVTLTVSKFIGSIKLSDSVTNAVSVTEEPVLP